MMETRCSRCGATFACNPGPDCWCMRPPYLPLPQGEATCLCPVCLDRARVIAAERPPS